MDGLLKDIIEHGLGKTPWCLLGSDQKYFEFKCIYSTIDHYQTNQSYSLYELNSLERFLAKKNKLLRKEILEEIYNQDESKTLSYIINWDAHSKIVLLLQVNSPLTAAKQIQKTLAIVAKNRIQINQLFQESTKEMLNG